MENDALVLYRLLTYAENTLVLKYMELPIYAVRLLLYLYYHDAHGDNILSHDIKNEFHWVDNKLFRVVNDYLKKYIDIDHIKLEDIKNLLIVIDYRLSAKLTSKIY